MFIDHMLNLTSSYKNIYYLVIMYQCDGVQCLYCIRESLNATRRQNVHIFLYQFVNTLA